MGGTKLRGEVTVCGAKNAAVAILPAAILAEGVVEIENLPNIRDVELLCEILGRLGAKVDFDVDESMAVIDTSPEISSRAVFRKVSQLRASYYFLGALLSRYGKAEVALPGGCDIGVRPIDQHIKGLEALGAEVVTEHGMLKAKADKLVGAEVYLDVASVGATINIMLAAVKAEGNTVIVNAAKEPHVVDLANFLNTMGAKVKGAGTDIIRIRGVERMHGACYAIIPDQIEAGTLMIAAAATKGDVKIKNVITTHLEAISAKLMEMGVKVVEGENYIQVISDKRPRQTTVKTLPYPGFPTDMQQPISALLCVSTGTSVVIENIFEERFKHITELQRMGAKINVDNRVAVIEGVEELSGCLVTASDLRAGAALIVAGLMARGETQISNVKFIDRGYENIEQKLRALGAQIKRIMVDEDEDDD